MKMVLEKILQSSVAQFEFSCTYLAHRHGVQQNVGLTFFIQRLQTFFIFWPFFTFLTFFKFLLERFLHLCSGQSPAEKRFVMHFELKVTVPWSHY